MRRFFLSLCALAVTACTGSQNTLQGPAVDLHALATPTPPATPPVVFPPPVSVPPGKWRIWIPPQTNEHGEQVEGHWTTIALAPPVIPAVVTPAKPMPRAPKHRPAPKAAAKPAPPEPPVEGIPQVPQGIPNAALPSGLRARGQTGPGLAPQPLLGVPQ